MSEKQKRDPKDWDRFQQSGKVADYMAYAAGVSAMSPDMKLDAAAGILLNSAMENPPPKEEENEKCR